MHFPFKKHSPSHRGFSLIEVLVTLAILGIIFAMTMGRYGQFNNIVLLKNAAFQVALDIRQAQVYASSVRSDTELADLAAAARLRDGVGVYFNKNNVNSYILFLDDGNSKYLYTSTGPNADTPLRGISVEDTGSAIGAIKLDDRFKIKSLCVKPASGSEQCGISTLHITFNRPNFDAVIRYNSGSIATAARIELEAVKNTGPTRSVIISSTGQISVTSE